MPVQRKPSKLKIFVLTLYILFLFATSLIPMDREIEGLEFIFAIEPTLQNLLHIPVYMVLSILWLQVLQPHEMSGRRKVVLVFLLSSLIGIVTELVQTTVPGRYPSLLDTTFNFLGSILGIVLYYRLYRTNDSFIRRLVCE
jgi:glycopeptide antibiotics resistance protein